MCRLGSILCALSNTQSGITPPSHNSDHLSYTKESSLITLYGHFYPLATADLFPAATVLPFTEIHTQNNHTACWLCVLAFTELNALPNPLCDRVNLVQSSLLLNIVP